MLKLKLYMAGTGTEIEVAVPDCVGSCPFKAFEAMVNKLLPDTLT